MFSEALGSAKPETEAVRPGDALEVWLWEAPPASLFGVPATVVDAPAVAKTITLPEQMVRGDGYISVPFIGQVQVADSTVFQIEERIKKQLAGLANDPQVLVTHAQLVVGGHG
jgi:polysaccharide export outer membrane protein